MVFNNKSDLVLIIQNFFEASSAMALPTVLKIQTVIFALHPIVFNVAE